ncbi:MAG: NAD(P)-binding domain-containing protein [Microthrixaceae bacterium]
MRIGVLGATGPAGSGLAARLSSVGFEVVIGSRSKYRAMEVPPILERWPDKELLLEAGDNHEAWGRPTSWSSPPVDAASTAQDRAAEMDGKVVISMANALAKGHEFRPLCAAEGFGGCLCRLRCRVAGLRDVPPRPRGAR